MNWQLNYPGMRLVHGSAEAQEWSAALGMPFHEAVIEANGHNLTLVFADLVIDVVEPGQVR